ncbi:AMP-binding protein [Aestuariirhabdus litorea]|uniref:AMP-dependent synthetase n=1 Tax=Aestuariirhabdus litorea TaxID=2528527 RepID=A0A3P3VUC4_9GAMM|nr:AMP-binding protein [Aestuariirhabdus litorea]RRJ85216.1 AMP-dependent synthetase [Aestuariirhabdus litorea]RWW98437.1 AMP-dependent synthetase [Endozoicomonadaceae bacterium GTF-13]
MDYRLPLAQLAHNVATHPDKAYLHQPKNRQWTTLSWGEVDQQARRIASALKAQGFVEGDRIAIFAKNSAEWFITDFAIMMAGMISVPIYATAGADTIRHILNHSEAKAIFIGKLDSLDAGKEAIPESLLRIAYPYPTLPCQVQWEEWLQQYPPLEEVHNPDADDTVTLVYTSGSTGVPKGVVLSYRNVASSSYCSSILTPHQPNDCTMSYLPLAHITERCVVELMTLYSPIEIYFVESLDTFIDDVKHARPTLFISVPRLWTKFQAQVLAQLPQKKLQRLLKIPLLNSLVKRKIRKALGLDQTRVFGSGSAPISVETLRWYARLGIHISEGWGMTETSGLSCGNNPFSLDRLGTIGVPQQCVEMKLSEEGEVLIRGDAVFREYYRNPEATAEAFVDGWFRTGDRGAIREDGSWEIVGRVKEQFKTGKGKYVAPVPIESMLGRNHDIEQVCVMGSGRKQPLAVIVLNAQLQDYSPDTEAALQRTLDEVNAELESHQRLDHLIVSEEAWDIENGLLTPTLKLKRDQLEKRYGHLLSQKLDKPVVWENRIGN